MVEHLRSYQLLKKALRVALVDVRDALKYGKLRHLLPNFADSCWDLSSSQVSTW